MGFIIATPQAIPVNPDTSQRPPTWGESGGPFTEPGTTASGVSDGNALFDDDLNWPLQHDARWLRALRDRVVFSDEGLFTSCIVRQGTWNIGGGTLGVTLTPTRLVVDVDGDGGTVLELRAPVGSPEVLAASSDTYLDIDEAGGYTLAVVPNETPPPPLTPGHVRVYRLVTDATELTSVELETGVAPFPCLGPTVGAVDLRAVDLVVANASTFEGASEFQGAATFGGSTVIGTATDDDITVGGPLSVFQRIDHRSHATTSTWADGAGRQTVSAFGSGTVPGGGGTVALKQITATSNPTREQILAPDPCLMDIEMVVMHRNMTSGERRNDRIVAQYTVSGGTMTLTASNVLTSTQEAPNELSALILPSGAVLQVTFGGTAGAAGETTRYGYMVSATIMPL